ncbi:MAG: hypothetical protein JO149_03415, partial [Gammaproteobacteria bacterium]|nr:hypothetical protein [Gammaproteobacteria bacterium]
MMMNKRLITLLIIYALPFTVFGQSVDSILRNADLPKLIGTDQAVNLAAQPLDP